jgi:hypothetical protein
MNAMRSVAEYRRIRLSGLDQALEGFAEIGQPRWAPWRTKLQLTKALPAAFSDALDALRTFANPILTESTDDSATWNPALRIWEST